MCYKSPGPRCSSHAHVNLKRAVRRYLEASRGQDAEVERIRRRDGGAAAEDQVYTLYCAARVAQDEFDATPRGQETLRGRIKANGDANGALQYRLDRGIASRKHALAALAVADQGDVNEDTSRHTDATEPKSRRAYVSALEKRAQNLQTALAKQDSASDLDVVGVAQEDLTELTSSPAPASAPKKKVTAPVRKAVTTASRRIATSGLRWDAGCHGTPSAPSCHGIPTDASSSVDCHASTSRLRTLRSARSTSAGSCHSGSCH